MAAIKLMDRPALTVVRGADNATHLEKKFAHQRSLSRLAIGVLDTSMREARHRLLHGLTFLESLYLVFTFDV